MPNPVSWILTLNRITENLEDKNAQVCDQVIKNVTLVHKKNITWECRHADADVAG